MEQSIKQNTEARLSVNANIVKQTFPVTGMTCAACAVSVESMLANTPGVMKAGVNFATQTAWAEFNPEQATVENLRSSVQEIGYDLIVDTEDASQAQADEQGYDRHVAGQGDPEG